MTTINDFSDEPRYTIKSVSVQTGIRPVTLRAWNAGMICSALTDLRTAIVYIRNEI